MALKLWGDTGASDNLSEIKRADSFAMEKCNPSVSDKLWPGEESFIPVFIFLQFHC